MKAKNAPFEMDADDVAMLAMSHLRGSGKLNDKNVDCFIQGYKACSNALLMVTRFIPVLKYHQKQFSEVEKGIADYIGYSDLRRGYNAEERGRIERAEKIAEAMQNLIDTLEKYAK